MEIKDIKLIIWDLDNTFWQGIISEGDITPVPMHMELVRMLDSVGIVNSISSKNDESVAYEKLTELGIRDYFVFNDINWDAKGPAISRKLDAMGLRAANTLFIDDDSHNLEEVRYHNPEINVALPTCIQDIYNSLNDIYDTLPKKSRLEQYKILEVKDEARKQCATNDDFLRQSDIRVYLSTECYKYEERIIELIKRTNQLNYTKRRDSEDEIIRKIESGAYGDLCIYVQDKYGDYGLVGYVCQNLVNGEIEHFLFSCRTLGMGVERFIYQVIGKPHIDVVGPVAVDLDMDGEVDWISLHEYDEASAENLTKATQSSNAPKILLKGPCDMDSIGPYLIGGDITTEYNYMDDRGVVVAGMNHTMNICHSQYTDDEALALALKDADFISEGDYKTSLFSQEYHYICLSMLSDCHAGLYRHRKTGAYISFGSRCFDMTDPDNFGGYIDGSIVNHCYGFTEDILNAVKENWEYVGATSPEALVNNLEYIYKHVPGKPHIILLLGSEIPCEGNIDEFRDHDIFHKEMNPYIREFAKDKERVHLVEFSEFIGSREDYVDCVNHFSRNVYYNLATRIVSIINGEY